MSATSKGAFNRLNSKLVAAAPHEFQRLALRLICFLAPYRLGTSTLGDFCLLDGNLIVWNGNEGAELVVRCTGFDGAERDLGQEKVEECVKSIETFAEGRLRAKVFLVVHNRAGESEGSPKGQIFRKQVDQALDSLKSSNQVKRVEQWNCRALLAQLEKALKERIIDFFKRTRPETYGVSVTDEVVKVPLEKQLRTFDRLQLKAADDQQVLVADPAAELTSIGSGLDARAILLGHAGFGKTVAVNRTARGTPGPLILVRAADLAEDATNRNSLLDLFPTVDQLLAGFPDEDIPTFKPLVLAVMEGVLSMPGVAAFLVIDGLDESIALSRPGGLVWLLNILKRYQLPVILTCRSEFWHARVADFEAAFGIASPRPGPMQRNTKLKIIELLPWEEEQILSLSESFRDCLTDVTERDHIQQFIQLVKDGQYAAIYGDIPKRPLFLQWILETVAELGIHRVTPVQLLEEFAERKINRDFTEPRRDGGSGRPSILESGEALNVTIDLAFRAMMRAARLMSNISSNRELELLPSCEIGKVVEAEPSLCKIDDPMGLFLFSLFEQEKGKGLSTTVRFGHSVYHEFFLAKFIEQHPEQFGGVKIPQIVEQWFRAPRAFRSSSTERPDQSHSHGKDQRYDIPWVESQMSDTEAIDALLVKIGNLKGLLASRATNGDPSEEEYGKLRAELVKIEPIRALLPKFVLTCRTIREFWAFIKPKFPTHKERLAFLQSEFDPILTALEQGVTPPTSGRVYAAAPNPDLVLVTVNQHETQAVHDAFREATGTEGLPVSLEGRLYHSLGTLNDTTVYHAISEMGSGGPGAMQQAADKAIRALDPGAVIAVGIAFGVSEKDQAIGDILLSKQVRLYDLQRAGAAIVLRGDKAHASSRLINHFEGFSHVKWKGAKVHPGVILSGEKLIDNIDYREQLLKLEVEAVGGEMEGAGLYVSSHDHKVDWIVIKAICDWADGNKKKNKTHHQKKAAKNAAEFLVEALKYAPLKRV